jgi:hypothetical protein
VRRARGTLEQKTVVTMQAPRPELTIGHHTWASSDAILLIFAASGAEFALNRAVDWLFFTGAILRDPIGRFLSTVRHAQDMVFADEATRRRTLAMVNAAHRAVEKKRGAKIPAWAYRDVLYMLIDYTERAHDLIIGPSTRAERAEAYTHFRYAAEGLEIEDVPATYEAFVADREAHMARDLAYSDHSAALYRAFRQHLGPWRYEVLRSLQGLMVPERVRSLLGLREHGLVRHALRGYTMLERVKLRSHVQRLLIPGPYIERVRAMDRPHLAAA